VKGALSCYRPRLPQLFHAKRRGEIRDGLDHGIRTGAVGKSEDEAAIDFDLVEWEGLKKSASCSWYQSRREGSVKATVPLVTPTAEGWGSDHMEAAHGAKWWETNVPPGVLEEVRKNREREAQAAVSVRSEDDIDYTTFGQLGDIIRANWSDFAGMLSNQSAVSRVMSALNMLRGTIAHCGVLAEDEVDRLKLAIRDWFRVLEGPKA